MIKSLAQFLSKIFELLFVELDDLYGLSQKLKTRIGD